MRNATLCSYDFYAHINTRIAEVEEKIITTMRFYLKLSIFELDGKTFATPTGTFDIWIVKDKLRTQFSLYVIHLRTQ